MVNRIILAGLILLALVGEAAAQCTGQPAGNTVCAAPNGAAGLPTFRPLVSGDLPAGGGAVTSVFTRTGAVVAASGDYSFSQISGTQALSQMANAAANTLYGNLAANTPAAVAVPACAAGSALGWNAGSGFICTAIAAAPVTSVFTRTGAVVAAANDYSFAQISGTLATGQLPAGVTSTIASGTAAMGTGAIASATCATAVTASATNVATTDAITVSFNGDPTAVTGYVPLTTGMLTIIPYPTANNVNFKVCNNTSASITPGAITLNWRVVR